MKQAIFLVINYGEEGRGPEDIVFASTNEVQRDTHFTNLGKGDQPYYKKEDRVYDLAKVREETLKQLNGLQRLSIEPQRNTRPIF